MGNSAGQPGRIRRLSALVLQLRISRNYAGECMSSRTHHPSPDLALPGRARATPQRRAVLDAIAAWDGSFTVVELYDRARRAYPRLSLATTYRTVELLRRAGTVRPLPTDERPAYIRCHAGHHHHLICLVCGAVEETELCAAPRPSELKRRYGFAAESHEVDIYGTCARCHSQQTRAKPASAREDMGHSQQTRAKPASAREDMGHSQQTRAKPASAREDMGHSRRGNKSGA
jgi:Fur family ferric uptake transcriptional regulator